jgi:hypothetical protein
MDFAKFKTALYGSSRSRRKFALHHVAVSINSEQKVDLSG